MTASHNEKMRRDIAKAQKRARKQQTKQAARRQRQQEPQAIVYNPHSR